VGQAIEGEFMAMVQPGWTALDYVRHYGKLAAEARSRGDDELAARMHRAQEQEVLAAAAGL
jgi:hypothetical protein